MARAPIRSRYAASPYSRANARGVAAVSRANRVLNARLRSFTPAYNRSPMATGYGGAGQSRNVRLLNMRTGGLLGIETKFLDVTASVEQNITAPVDASGGEIQPASGAVGCLNAPAQGSSSSEREGRQIAMRNIYVQGMVAIQGTNAPDVAIQDQVLPTVYVALVQDTQTNGVTVNSEDIFKNLAGTALMAASPFTNMSNSKRFKILKTRTILPKEFSAQSAVNDAAASTVSQNIVQVPFKFYYSFGKGADAKVNFMVTATTADVANVIDNSLHIIAFTSSIGQVPKIAWASRLRFVG